MQEYRAASAFSSSALSAEHAAAWAELHRSGFDIEAANASVALRALDVATHAHSSRYYLLPSIRPDWYPGVSPGGASTQNYQGAVFMDMDWWMEPSLYLLAPSYARALLESQFLSINASKTIAKVFGYQGFMFAWTAAYLGRPFGCCNGPGGYEGCFEQHITGDVAFSAWQYYHATGDRDWLASRGWPLLSYIATFHMSRVTPVPQASYVGAYSIRAVLPIDEWCVGSGCETPGVDDDAHMNGVAKASLITASAAAKIFGVETDETRLWGQVGQQLQLLFHSSGGHHNQFTSRTCPDGWGGSHCTPSHTVRPEDVLMLSYPLGKLLNISNDVTKRDAEVFVPITCRENAGMTPMHTIVWLSVDEPVLAQAEFNRSMHAACYGAFNVRNEVDKHLDIPGRHLDNSHFLTGDGGFLQALLNGYGGLHIDETGLIINRPALPEAVGVLRLRGLAWRSLTLTATIDDQSVTLTASAPYCVTDANEQRLASPPAHQRG